MFGFNHCACTPQDRQIVFQIVGALMGALALLMIWVNWRGWQNRRRLLRLVKESPFGYERSQSGYRVWDKRSGESTFQARSEAEAIGWIGRMSRLETKLPLS